MKTIIIFALLLCVNKGYSQQDTISIADKAYQASLKMTMSFQENDFETFVSFIHPKIIIATGGKDSLISMLKKGLGTSYKILSTSISKPDTVISKDSTLQCSMNQRQEMEMDGKKLYTTSSVIGISYDQGKTWYFIAVTKKSLEELIILFPELSDALIVKKQSRPILME